MAKKSKLENIKVRKQSPADDGWQFIVEVGEEEGKQEHTVLMDRDYWQKLTKGVGAPADLIKKSFEFLLKREPKESILKSFDLRDIKKHFSDFEREIAPTEPYLEARIKK
ncbi:MAG: hypothetical protein HYT12_04860 [Candidatus Liptonbacteria bacterium]|nr:hypothetical protein [Candidatus Liptonbacteria bacterium]